MDKKINQFPVVIGKDLSGATVTKDLNKLKHILVAGAPGTGKTTWLKEVLSHMVMDYDSNEFELMAMCFFGESFYDQVDKKYFTTEPVTTVEAGVEGLRGLVEEMERRYHTLGEADVTSIYSYNKKAQIPMKRLIVMIDDFSDLMKYNSNAVELSISQLALMSNRVGIHIILCTHRVHVSVLTGMIKGNIPTKIAFKTVSAMDSRTIISRLGAEQLDTLGEFIMVQDEIEHLLVK